MQQLATLQTKLENSIGNLRRMYPSFDEAISSYTAQYGEGSVRVYETFKISDTIDPVIIILGRTTPLFYRHSKRELSGKSDSIIVESSNVYVLGRREPSDSKLVVWSDKGEFEIEKYDSRAMVIPSRIHAAVFGLDNEEVVFADLGSTSGSILAGETSKPEPFMTLYGPPHLEIHRVSIPAKYAYAKRA